MQSTGYKRVVITRVDVDSSGQEAIQKKEGSYLTLTVPSLHADDNEGLSQLEESLFESLTELHADLSIKPDEKILIIGLGNKTITPDAIGPMTLDAMQSRKVEMEADSFILFSPGVTAQTGYETSEFIMALAKEIQPKLVLVIDALATKASERLCRTIQITNTGIHPGSGVGNERAEVSEETIGVPVTAIGIPTVVGGPVLVSDAIERVFQSIAAKILEKGKPSGKLSVSSFVPNNSNVDLSVTESVFGEWVHWSKEDRQMLLQEVLSNQVESLIVTPKDVDLWLVQYSVLLTNALYKWLDTISSK